MSGTTNGTAEFGSSSNLPPTVVPVQTGQGDEAAWNFGNVEDKNPFSEFSEEHLNKLDEVLSSVEVQEILQQSATNISLDMSLEGAGSQSGDGPGNSEPVVLQESDLAVLSAAFSDHAYAVPPDKAPKQKLVTVTTAMKPRPIVVTVGSDDVHEDAVISTPTLPMIVTQTSEDAPVIEISPPSPVEFSPRKSGRAAKAKRYGEEEWVTSSPRGRGRGRGSPSGSSPLSFSASIRQSSRISDQKQRELAEKILQANRQALEAEKLTGSSVESLLGNRESLEPKGHGQGRSRLSGDEDDHVDVDDIDVEINDEKVPSKGRGRGRGRGRGKKVPDDEKKVGRDSEEVNLNESMTSSQDEEMEESDIVKSTDNSKTAENSESESDVDKDTVEEKKVVAKKKPRKKSMWEPKRRKKKKKVVKAKGKKTETETEETVDSESDKSDEDNDDDEEEEEAKDDESRKKTVTGKGKKSGKVKDTLTGKKVKAKEKKGKTKVESEDSEMETDDKVEDKKTVKPLSKLERLKKLREASKAKKSKLLEKKKAKLKEKKSKLKGKKTKAKLKVKLPKKGKVKESGTESEKSPKKKKTGKDSDDTGAKAKLAKKKGIKETDNESDVEEKPKGKKKGLGASPAKKKKLKAAEEKDESSDQASPKKKKGKLAKAKAVSPVKKKKVKTDTEADEESESDQKKTKKMVKVKKAGHDSGIKPGSPQKKKKGKQKEVDGDKSETDLKKSPVKSPVKTTVKSPVKTGKRKDGSDSDTVPAKKQKLVTETEKAVTKDQSDSDDDIPLKKIKIDLQEESKTDVVDKIEDLESQTDKVDGKIIEEAKTEQTTTVLKIETETESDKLVTKHEESTKDTKVESETVSDKASDQKEQLLGKTENETSHKKDGKRKLSVDKDSFETPSKRRDSRDSSKDSKDEKHRHRHHSHHHHHHHRHSRDSRDSASDDRKHSHDRKDSHRRESGNSSHDRRKSSSVDKDRDRKEPHDRKGSVSKDQKESKKVLGKPLKKEERTSISGSSSDKKVLKTPAKIERKKSRKSEDMPVDPLWTDLFKPDITPKQKDKLKKETENGITPLKSGIAENKPDDTKAVSLGVGVNKTESSDQSREGSVGRSHLSIFDKFNEISQKGEKINVISEMKESKTELVAKKGDQALTADENVSVTSKPDIENLPDIESEMKDESKTDIECKESKTDENLPDIKLETAANLLKPLADDECAYVDVEIKEKKNESISDSVKTEAVDKTENIKVGQEKVLIGDSEIKTIKVPVPSAIKKEKSDKVKSDKKVVDKDKAKLLKERHLSGKEKKKISKDKTPSKHERARSLSSEKGRKLSPDKTSMKSKLTQKKKEIIHKKKESEKERRLSGEAIKKRHMSGDSVKKRHVSGEGKSRPTRNKSVAFAEILKKEKLGSDDGEEDDDDSDYNDDETDETWEEPGKLYCLCRQPHNKRFMICCDKCEEWFHGKCVGISRARGEEMEKNDEEYICPQCSEKETESDEKTVVTSTESPDQSHRKAEDKSEDCKERVSLSESFSTTDVSSTHADDKSDTTELPKPDSTVTSPVKRDSLDSQTSPKGKPKHGGEHTPMKGKIVEGGSPKKWKSPEGKGYIRKRSPKDTSPAEKKKRIKSFKPEKPKTVYSTRKCLCGCNKLAKMGSLFSEKDCEIRHEEQKREEAEALAARKAALKMPQERRIAVVERGTGKTLTGHKAPRESELSEWLTKHPTFEVLKSHRRFSKETSKDRASDSSEVSDREKSADDSRIEKPLPEGPEPVRLNVRKGLRDALAARADAAEDIVLSNSEIKGLSLTIEEEMFKCFKDTDHKYKAKYRSLVFNIKDQKNNGLFRKILNRRIRPYQLVRMSPEELASQELSKWREHETKHQLEMIEQTEEQLAHEHPHIMKKTHKGEVEVEEEGEEDLSSLSVTEPKKEAAKIDPKADVLAAILPDTTEQHGKHLFDSNCKVCTGKTVLPHEETSDTSKTTVVHDKPKPKEEEREPTQKEKDLQAEEVVKEVLKAIKKAQAEAQREAQEAQKQASSVTVRSPDSALSSGLEKKAKFTPSGPQLWKGFVYMQDVSKFVTTAYRVTGPADNLDLPDTIHVCGRINPEHVWDYLTKIKQAASRDICVIRFIPGNNEEKAAYINLYSYLNSRSRCGVVANSAKHIKDFYIVPLASHSKIPSVLKPFDGPGLEENRCHMLIGVIIRNKVKSGSVSAPSSQPHKQDPRKLKSNLKDPVGDDKASSSTSSSPTSSASSATVTPQEKKKKAKSISFDPIVKEYSHVSSDQDDPDVSYDPNAPYDPEKEAESTAPKQEDRPYSPSQDELFGIAVSLETGSKEKSKDDAVSKMIEKIAQSKNPVEATATMVAALATSSRLGNQNQRKLLLELTKKVDEQKRMLERKRISSARSPSNISSTLSPSDKSKQKSGSPATTSGTSPHGNKSKMNKNDPRLKAKKSSDSSVSNTEPAMSTVTQTAVPVVYSPLKDLQASRAAKSSVAQKSLMSDLSKTDSKDSTSSSPTIKPFSFTVKSKSHSVSKSVVEEETSSKVALAKLDEDATETLIKPKGFYVDHGEKASSDQDTTGQLGSSVGSVQHSQGSGWKAVISEASEIKTTSVLDKLKNTESAVRDDSKETESAVKVLDDIKNAEDTVDKLNGSDKTEEKSVSSSKVDNVTSSKAFDIVSHLQAEVSGTAKPDTVTPSPVEIKEKADKDSSKTEGKEALDILSQLHASVWGAKSNKDQSKEPSLSAGKTAAGSKSSHLETDSAQGSVKLPPNILNILKEVTEKPSAKTQPKQQENQQSGQLPKSLMSLFSGIPSGGKTGPENKADSNIGDEDLRLQSKKTDKDSQKSTAQVNPALEAKAEVKVSKEKLTKSFLGFDYDSDSDSEGSFEGFDDDGLKSLSPRKRKLVTKQSPIRSAIASGSTNVFGDVDIRVKAKQVDEQGAVRELASGDKFEFPAEDVDFRQKPIEVKESAKDQDKDERISQGQPLLDKDERNQKNVDLKVSEEKWDVSAFPTDIDERLKKRVPPAVGVVFTTPDTIGMGPPVLHDVDHRRHPFPPGSIPPGIRPLLPFMGSNQPPPPGEDWQPGQPAPPPLPPVPLGVPPPLPKEIPPPPPKQPIPEATESEDDQSKIDEKDRCSEKEDKTPDDSKDKTDESGNKEKKDKKKKKKKEKKKGELSTSDARLKAIVLEIARNEPIEPPPLPPILNPPVPVFAVPPLSGPPPISCPTPLTGPPSLSGHPTLSGPPPLSGPPAPMLSMPGPMLTQPPILNPQPPVNTQPVPPAASQGMPFSSQGPPVLTAERTQSTNKWQGPPATSSPGPPSLFEIDVTAPNIRSSRPPKLQPSDRVNPSPPPLAPNLPPSKQQGLLPTPPMPPNIAGGEQGPGPIGPPNLPVGPNTVSSIGPPPLDMQAGGPVDSPRLRTEDDSYPPPLLPGLENYSYDRERDRDSRDRHRERYDRHSGRGSRERDSDRYRHNRYSNDRDSRSNRDRHDRSDRHSSDRHRDDYHSDRRSSDRRDDDRHRDGDNYRDNDRRREDNRDRDDRRHERYHRDDDRHSDRSRDDRYRDRNRRSRH